MSLRSLLFVVVVSFLCSACRDKGTEPCTTCSSPGRRDYNWSTDTLAYPGSLQITMHDIWGSSNKNVYTVGHNDQNSGKMYHYDGQLWKPVQLTTAEGRPIQNAIDLWAVYGFGPANVWSVGSTIFWDPIAQKYSDSSLIIHFDGSQWNEAHFRRKASLTTVWGSAPNDVWAGGEASGSLYHFDGTAWGEIPFDTTKGFNSIFGFSSNVIYATCTHRIDVVAPEDSSQFFLFRYNGQTWTPIDSFITYPGYSGPKFGYSKLWGTSETKLYSIGEDVYRRDGSEWQPVLNTTLPFYGLFGTGDLNVFAVGMYRQIFQYNGTDWFRFSTFIDVGQYCEGIWCDQTQVFILCSDGLKTSILHGK